MLLHRRNLASQFRLELSKLKDTNIYPIPFDIANRAGKNFNRLVVDLLFTIYKGG